MTSRLACRANTMAVAGPWLVIVFPSTTTFSSTCSGIWAEPVPITRYSIEREHNGVAIRIALSGLESALDSKKSSSGERCTELLFKFWNRAQHVLAVPVSDKSTAHRPRSFH